MVKAFLKTKLKQTSENQNFLKIDTFIIFEVETKSKAHLTQKTTAQKFNSIKRSIVGIAIANQNSAFKKIFKIIEVLYFKKYSKLHSFSHKKKILKTTFVLP